MPAERRRLLTISHSYVVAENRRLADQLAQQGDGRWEVTALAPEAFRGDLRRIPFEPIPDERCRIVRAPVRFDRNPHLMWYAGVRAVLRERWDVVHCWEEPYVHAAARIARTIRRDARFVVSTFQNIAKTYPWPLSRFERQVMRRADGWIAFGASSREALQERRPYASTPVRVIPPGVDLVRFAPSPREGAAVRQRLGWTGDDFVVGYLGRFVPEKGLATLMAALAALDGSWRALFVGGGPLEPELRDFAHRFPGRVHVQTDVAHGDVPQWLNAMSVLCAPSETTPRWREQFGRMLIEAMSCGVPVVASRSGEMPHVVGEAGVLVGERDVPAWRGALAELRGDAAARARCAVAGRARVQARFAWRDVAARHLDFFDAVLEGRSG